MLVLSALLMNSDQQKLIVWLLFYVSAACSMDRWRHCVFDLSVHLCMHVRFDWLTVDFLC